jgi:O-antigen ligase
VTFADRSPTVFAATLGLLIALITTVALTNVEPPYLIVGYCGLAVLVPTFMMRDAKNYWLFLLFVSIPIDVYKRATSGIIDPWLLFQKYGLPAVETLSVDIYLTDIIQFAMILPWVARLSLRREKFYFPKVGYVYVAFLAYSLMNLLINSVSFHLAIFEWCRELLYFLSFLYLANNVATKEHFRAIALGLLIGVAIEICAIFLFYFLQVGTEKPLFSVLYSGHASQIGVVEHTHYAGEAGAEAHIKRSAGTFGHPALAAYYLCFVLHFTLASAMSARDLVHRAIYGAIYVLGFVALVMTFSRSGLLGFLFGLLAFLPIARRARLISARTFENWVVIFVAGAAISAPLILAFLWTRPEAAHFRLGLVEKGLHDFWERPIFGAGLNNSTAVLEGARRVLPGHRRVITEKLHVHYLVVLVEGGLIGFTLFFGFFALVARKALSLMPLAGDEMKPILIGSVAAMADVAVQNFGDPFQGHAPSAMLWLYCGLVVAIERHLKTPGEAENLKGAALPSDASASLSGAQSAA